MTVSRHTRAAVTVAIILIVIMVVIASLLIGWRFDADMQRARTRAAAQSC